MGTITCRNADAPVTPVCSIIGVNAAVTGDRVDVSFAAQVNGTQVPSLGALCYRVAGTTLWTEIPAGTQALAHTVSLTNQADGTYEFQAKANVNGVLCQSPIATYVVDDGTVEPTDCAFCQTGPVIVMEAEDGDIQGSDWIVSNLVAGNSGSGHLHFNAPTLTINGGQHDIEGGDTSQTVKYNLLIKTAGDYLLKLRASALFDTEGDKNNDVWVEHTGGNVTGQLPTANDVEKMYLSGITDPQPWEWTSSLDPTPPAVDGGYWMALSAGSHCITLTGRSGQFYIDRLALCLNGQGDPNSVVSTACTGGTTPIDGINLTPEGKPTATGRFVPCDLISLHYDAAPDPDDNHAIAAGSCLLDCYGISDTDRYCVAVGAYGLRAADGGNPIGGTRWGVYLPNAETVAQAAYGSGNWDLVRGTDNGQFLQVPKFAKKWKDTINAGCKVYVAEGGPSDFTAQVAQYMQNTLGCTAAELQQITVVQHSTSWNEANTDPGNLAWVKSNLNYVAIDNGNLGGSFGQGNTAFLQHHPGIPRTQPGVDATSFFNKVKAGPCGAAWSAAESAYDATLPTVVDFSDTVELLWILSISQGDNGTISNITDFCNTFAT